MTAPPADLLQGLLALVEAAGVAVCAIAGALAAARHRMDYFGFIVVGAAAALGGGTVRDVVLGLQPVFWAGRQDILLVAIVAALATFWLARLVERWARALDWFDAVGMALFTVVGTEKALRAGAPPVVAMAMGVVTACFGGVIRDILCGDKPMLFHKEVYATASLAGAAALVGMTLSGLGGGPAAWAGFAAALAVRSAAIVFGWSFPPYGGR
ncbi:conserved membrane hypothetical protein [Magnetospirillum sp. LM-5]|uniref:trimeric intracellular cation channel family protein n=1 Tax=Magnetospirillum sp. LM-5 TaxID=2681466 RepID=UPI00137E8E17|nr:TRIC cation channel family protein [Magnetospirillum sp. LM-5]CAA7616484.1 conserved membrane hypothetical protein [Magnetospirillum sp. LM-5]